MGRFSILSRKNRLQEKPTPILTEDAATELSRPTLRFPVSDTGGSLADMAGRDLEAALQLLAERAQYITGASGAAIALRKGGEIVCRASAGPSAPEVGVQLQINSGLSGESIRTQQILRCDNAETDTRVNRESCRALGIASVVVLPLVHDGEVNGVFELFSGRANAFEERDITALQRLSDMIQTAIQHSEASKRAEQEIAGGDDVLAAESGDVAEQADAPPGDEILESTVSDGAQSAALMVEEKVAAPKPPPSSPAQENKALLLGPNEAPAVAEEPVGAVLAHIKTCQSCGFPISESRTLCLDCESHQAGGGESEAFSQYQNEKSWIASNKYLIGIVLMVAATVVVLFYFR
jgi:putative methionine-R-sulfoxide reductase with GAF domain